LCGRKRNVSRRDIIAVCQRYIRLYPNDCAAFVRAVASDCGVLVSGDANSIVDFIQTGRRLSNGQAARQAAAAGDLVIAGVRGTKHGHVVIVVDGPMNTGKHPGKYPYAFWGQYHGVRIGNTELNAGFTRGNGTLNYAFNDLALNSLVYAAFTPLTTLLPQARPTEGYILPIFT
jgi:hypothetical protein